MKKKRVAIIFGGKSAEHEVSVKSAKNVLAGLDRDLFIPILIGISKKGNWYQLDEVPEEMVSDEGGQLEITLGSGFFASGLPKPDLLFPVLHGPFGEDGTFQGLAKMIGIPFVGAGVLGSALAMDKVVSKKLLQQEGVRVADFRAFTKKPDPEEIEDSFSYPVFVKPANLGSSVGVSKAENREELVTAVEEAFLYDKKILIEESIFGREVECSVLGNDNPKASVLGEVIPVDYYSYDEKYSNDSQAELKIPAELDPEIEKRVRDIAVRAFKILNCEGMARADFFISEGKIYLNELNTIPGFTDISMYPKLWEVSGLKREDLITELINLALKRHEEELKLKTDYR